MLYVQYNSVKCTADFQIKGRILERAFLEWMNCVGEEEFGGGDGVGGGGGGTSVVFKHLWVRL